MIPMGSCASGSCFSVLSGHSNEKSFFSRLHLKLQTLSLNSVQVLVLFQLLFVHSSGLLQHSTQPRDQGLVSAFKVNYGNRECDQNPFFL